tara:strand:+ start:432 stop:734 length:303 start_codon:yes stop_codon:yes gene_type:complete
MATTKTYSVAGTSTLNGVTKIRFANDFVSRLKILFKNGHENVELIELGGEFTKAEVCQILMSHPKMQSEDQQSAIYEFVVRNCKEIASEIEDKMHEAVEA